MADEEVVTVESVLNEQYGVSESMFANEVVEEAPAEDTEGVEGEAEEEVNEDVVEDEDLDNEDVDEDDDEEGEDSEADSEDNTEEADTDESVTQLEEVNSNLKRAMQSEREKRKQATEEVANLEAKLEAVKGSSDQYSKLVEQIKELGLEDVLEVQEEQALDPRIKQMLEEQEAAALQTQQAEAVETFKATMQSEVHSNVGNYVNIDTNDDKQGAILAQMIVSDVIQGSEVEDAVAKNLKLLDAMLAPAKRKPKVVPTKKVRSATKTTKDVSSRRKAKAVQEGDMSSVFADIGARLAGE